MLNHKNEPLEEMTKAKEVLTKAKLDGCVHRCALCGSKYNSVANFTRHIKDVHQITRAQYRHSDPKLIISFKKSSILKKSGILLTKLMIPFEKLANFVQKMKKCRLFSLSKTSQKVAYSILMNF